MDDMEQSLALAKRTLGFLNQQDIVPHPLNYDVIYNYNRGHNKPLIQSVNDLILSKEKHKSDALAEIHAKLISNEVSTQQVDDIATKMTEQITQITEVISTASGETTSYSDVLNKVSGVLNLDVDSEALKTMVGTLMSATTDMEKNLAQLENKLAMSNHQVSELNEHLHTVKMEARTDQLTGIYNRKYYDEAIALEIEVANTENTELCLLMGDIDKFKLFNDNYGHQTGDRVLRLVAQTMFNSVNEPDV
ncbi:MAG: GGDEF domain-containing protein, partial [Rhizobiales bacterium]|nr:GGDEF domain-containing protein [Hyphomicrobiales bacterium]